MTWEALWRPAWAPFSILGIERSVGSVEMVGASSSARARARDSAAAEAMMASAVA